MNLLFINDYQNIFNDYIKTINYECYINHTHNIDNFDYSNYNKIIIFDNNFNLTNHNDVILFTDNINYYYKNNYNDNKIFIIIDDDTIYDVIINELLYCNKNLINHQNKYLIYKNDFHYIINNYIVINKFYNYRKLIDVYYHIFKKLKYTELMKDWIIYDDVSEINLNIDKRILYLVDKLLNDDINMIRNRNDFNQTLNYFSLSNLSYYLKMNITHNIGYIYHKLTFSEKYLYIKNNLILKYIYDKIYFQKI